MIRKEGSKFVLYSRDGSKNLGTFDSEAAAKKHEQEVNYFKGKTMKKTTSKLVPLPKVVPAPAFRLPKGVKLEDMPKVIPSTDPRVQRRMRTGGNRLFSEAPNTVQEVTRKFFRLG